MSAFEVTTALPLLFFQHISTMPHLCLLNISLKLTGLSENPPFHVTLIIKWPVVVYDWTLLLRTQNLLRGPHVLFQRCGAGCGFLGQTFRKMKSSNNPFLVNWGQTETIEHSASSHPGVGHQRQDLQNSLR